MDIAQAAIKNIVSLLLGGAGSIMVMPAEGAILRSLLL